MEFNELCLLTESQSLQKIAEYIKKPNIISEMASKIKSHISRNIRDTDGQMVFYIGQPSNSKAYLTLIFFNVDVTTESGNHIPAKSFNYVVPAATQNIFRTNSNIKDTSKQAYLEGRTLSFHLHITRVDEKIDKVFPYNDLENNLKKLFTVAQYFSNNYGAQYSFEGDIYTPRTKNIFADLGKNLKQNWQDIKDMPGAFKDFWSNLG